MTAIPEEEREREREGEPDGPEKKEAEIESEEKTSVSFPIRELIKFHGTTCLCCLFPRIFPPSILPYCDTHARDR